MALFDHSTSNNVSLIEENDMIMSFSTTDIEIVFFDLETGGFDAYKHGILQICIIMSEKYELNIFITPTKHIESAASNVHELTKRHTKLFKFGREVNTVSITRALHEVSLFLQKINKKCILVAHNRNDSKNI